jgi:catechol 2,3-dioxygenase-like lactoylglutathione lyase family enzyme
MMIEALMLAAAAVSPEPEPLVSARGAFIALSVPDAEAAAAWYSDKLGLKIIMRPPEQGGVQMIALGGGGLLVELIEQQGAAPIRQIAPQVGHDTMVHGLFKAGVIVEDWEGLVAGLKARGVPIAIGPFSASAEQRANLIIRDNNGNYIQFFSNRPAPAETAKTN